MSLSSTSINRPVLAIVMSLLIMLFGIIGYKCAETEHNSDNNLRVQFYFAVLQSVFVLQV